MLAINSYSPPCRYILTPPFTSMRSQAFEWFDRWLGPSN